jgi:hypothetical protein
MTSPNQYLQAAIDRASEREAEIYAVEKRVFPGHASGSTDTPFGTVTVGFVAAAGVATLRREHLRQTWELDGKRIARDKLIALLRG